MILGIGTLPSLYLWFATNLTNFLVLEGIFITGALTLLESQWQVRYLARKNEREVFDSLRRSILRQLQDPYYPSFLEDIVRTGVVSRINVQAPISIPHLNESIDIAAKAPKLEELYTTLLEVKKLIDHLNFLHQVNPQIAVSPWAMQGLDVVHLELGFQIDETDQDKALALYRYYKIVLDRDMEEGKYRMLLDEWLTKAKDVLTRTIKQYNGDAVLDEPPPLQTQYVVDPFQDLRNNFVSRPNNIRQELINVRTSAALMLRKWKKKHPSTK